MSFTSLTTGHGRSFGGNYRDVVPFEIVRYASALAYPHLSGETQTTVTLKDVVVWT